MPREKNPVDIKLIKTNSCAKKIFILLRVFLMVCP